MLYSIDKGKYVIQVPHTREFKTWVSRLSAKEYEVIEEELARRIWKT